MERDKLPFRKNCEGYLIFEDKIVVRDTGWGYLEFPGGGLHEGEDFIDALKREAHEEAGVILDGEPREVKIIKYLYHSDWVKNDKHKRRYEKYRGDEMHFFLGKVKELVNPPGDGEEKGWSKDDRLMPIKKVVKILEGYKPFPKELEEYSNFQIDFLRGLVN